LKVFFFFVLISSNILFAQLQPEPGDKFVQKSNLEIFYFLADSSALNLISFLPANGEEVNLRLNLGSDYSMLGNEIISSLQQHSLKLSGGSGNQDENSPPGTVPVSVNFVIDNANVKYGEMFRKGFLGDYYIPRNIFLSGNFMIQSAGIKYHSFNYNFNDTVKVDEIKDLENLSFPFTRGEIPAEPFFSGLLEPVVAIGTAAVAVYLFFAIRSR
jgi:hypothetical protein